MDAVGAAGVAGVAKAVDLKTYLGDVLGREQALFTAKKIKEEITANMDVASSMHNDVKTPVALPKASLSGGLLAALGVIWGLWVAWIPVSFVVALSVNHFELFNTWGDMIGFGFFAAIIISVVAVVCEVCRMSAQNSENAELHTRAVELADTELATVKAEQMTRLAVLREKQTAVDGFITETQTALDALYSPGIIFGKYRHFVAVASFCEYIQSGRCDRLEGHEGAYNIYESELRQNVIIGQLDAALRELQEIRNTQYMLFEAISQTNSTLQGLTGEISGLKGAVVAAAHSAAKTSAMTAYFAKETANNTRLLVDVNRNVYGVLRNKDGIAVF